MLRMAVQAQQNFVARLEEIARLDEIPSGALQ
jgi:hypothetical protein